MRHTSTTLRARTITLAGPTGGAPHGTTCTHPCTHPSPAHRALLRAGLTVTLAGAALGGASGFASAAPVGLSQAVGLSTPLGDLDASTPARGADQAFQHSAAGGARAGEAPPARPAGRYGGGPPGQRGGHPGRGLQAGELGGAHGASGVRGLPGRCPPGGSGDGVAARLILPTPPLPEIPRCRRACGRCPQTPDGLKKSARPAFEDTRGGAAQCHREAAAALREGAGWGKFLNPHAPQRHLTDQPSHRERHRAQRGRTERNPVQPGDHPRPERRLGPTGRSWSSAGVSSPESPGSRLDEDGPQHRDPQRAADGAQQGLGPTRGTHVPGLRAVHGDQHRRLHQTPDPRAEHQRQARTRPARPWPRRAAAAPARPPWRARRPRSGRPGNRRRAATRRPMASCAPIMPSISGSEQQPAHRRRRALDELHVLRQIARRRHHRRARDEAEDLRHREVPVAEQPGRDHRLGGPPLDPDEGGERAGRQQREPEDLR